jgi:RNA polymerase sigma factor (sigma-70 family)
MSADDSLNEWLAQLSAGDSRGIQAIWDEYFQQLAFYARQKIGHMPRRIADEEDLALSAIHSFCRGVQAGRFPQLSGRDELWPLLVTITARKLSAHVEQQRARKRGGGKVRGESVFIGADQDEANAGIAQVLGREPTPELANMMAEECERLLDVLDDDGLRQVVLKRLEGYTCDEIAEQLGCATRSVERRLQRVRAKWSREFVA